MSVVAVVPVKPMRDALGRLAGVLERRERHELQAAMLRDVLGACRAASRVTSTLVVTGDAEAIAIARSLEARTLADHDPPAGMNAAVGIGLVGAEALRAEAALVLTADLPLATGDDLDAVVDDCPARPGAAIAPSLDGTGTNAMLLAPAGALRPELGIGSLARHLAQAAERAVPVRIVCRPGLALDVDTPEDLGLLCQAPAGSAARGVCERLGIVERMAAVGAR